MRRSTERIITSHAGTLPRPPDLRDMVVAKDQGRPVDEAAFQERVRSAVREVVQKQIECGIDIPNDGELSKIGFSNYIRDRMTGVEQRPFKEGDRTPGISGRDVPVFPDYFERRGAMGRNAAAQGQPMTTVCTGPIRYIGQATVQSDIDNLKAAIQGTGVTEAFLPAIAPGTVEHWLRNEYYPTAEAFLTAVADALHEEYQAIVDAGFVLQIDDPDLPDAWQIHPEMDVEDYRRFARVRVEALNHALRGLPQDRVRFHTCWGSYHGPHLFDIPLRDIVDLILSVNAECYSIEASNPRHDHEWRVWEEVKLPAGKSLMPGVIGHASDFIEHPQLVADRLVRYANAVGRENVIAGTDCGIGSRVGHPKICWAKFEAMAEGARLATKQLWGK
jgi:5-methyltetrahydropteroyltriglutamate--homocysteine methyltransferase